MRLPAALVFSLGLIAASLTAAPPAFAQAGDVSALTPLTDRDEKVALIAAYAGDWVARGTSRSNFGDPLEAASCRMSSVFDAGTETLTNDGRCANTQRAIELAGDLTVTEDGELDGGYFNRFDMGELLSSNGTAYEEGFIVEAVYLAEIGGDPTEIAVKVSVSRPLQLDNGDVAFSMVVEVVDPDTAEPVVFSELVFTQRS